MKEATAQDKIQSIITPYKNGQKKPSESDSIVIQMLEPLITKKYPEDLTKQLNAVINDLSAVLNIKFKKKDTQTISKKSFLSKKSVAITTTFEPFVGGDFTPGIHADIDALITQLKQKLSEITQLAAAAAPNNNAAELAEAKRQIEEANRRAAEVAAEKAKTEAALAEARKQAEETAKALAAEKAKPKQPVINSQAEAALAEANKKAEEAAKALAEEKAKAKKERERLRAERRAAKDEAKAKEKAAQDAQAQLKAKEAEVKEANEKAAKAEEQRTQEEAKHAEYRAGEKQRLHQVAIDSATQTARVMADRLVNFIDTNAIILSAIEQSFGSKEQFSKAFITGNTNPTNPNGNAQLVHSTVPQPAVVVAAATAATLNGNHQQVISSSEKQKYKDNLGETRFNIILSLLSMHDASKSKNERLMIQYLITQLAFHIDKPLQAIASQTSQVFHNKLFLAKDYPDFNNFLKSFTEDSSLENKSLTQDLCRFMLKRLSGKHENGVLLLPTDEAGVKLFTACYKALGGEKKIITPNLENTYRDAILDSLDLPLLKTSSPIHSRKENGVNGTAGTSRLTEVSLNQQKNGL